MSECPYCKKHYDFNYTFRKNKQLQAENAQLQAASKIKDAALDNITSLSSGRRYPQNFENILRSCWEIATEAQKGNTK